MIFSSIHFFKFYKRELLKELLDVEITSSNSNFETGVKQFNEDLLGSKCVDTLVFSNEPDLKQFLVLILVQEFGQSHINCITFVKLIEIISLIIFVDRLLNDLKFGEIFSLSVIISLSQNLKEVLRYFSGPLNFSLHIFGIFGGGIKICLQLIFLTLHVLNISLQELIFVSQSLELFCLPLILCINQ
jgi:hypothetical protein